MTGDIVLQQQIERAQRRISALHQRAQKDGVSAEPLLDESLAEMSVMLEELRVSDEELREQGEELREQSEELAAAHSIIDRERRRYQQLFNLAPDAYLATDMEGVIREANRAAGRLLRVDPSALAGKPLVVFVPDEDRRAFRSQFRKRLDGGPTLEWELRIQPRGSAPLEVAITTTAALGPQDETIGLLWLIRDVTERKRAEDMVRHLLAQHAAREVAEEEKRRAALLAEVSRVLASALDYEHTLRSVVGLIVPALADRCVVEVDGPQGPAHWVAAAPAPQSSEEAQPEPVDEIMLPLRARGNTLGSILFLLMDSDRHFSNADRTLAEEIADRAALAIDQANLYREAVAANQAKADFLAVMSHELRTPLNAVLGYTELLRMGVPEPVPQPSQQHVERIRLSAHHLLELIEEILTFSRMEAGKEEIHEEQIETDSFIHETAELMEPLAAEKQLDFQVDLSRAPAAIITDRRKLRQILLNLLSNAVKFTDRGEIRLSVIEEDAKLCFTVADTGIGIAPEHHQTIFDAFWQVDQETTRRAGGTGLGLSVVRSLARLLGGDVSIESTPGEGSTIRVWLPKNGSK